MNHIKTGQIIHLKQAQNTYKIVTYDKELLVNII